MRIEEGHRPSYESILRTSEWLKRKLFEHVYRNVPHDQFIHRLVEERWLLGRPEFKSLPSLTVAIFDGPSREAFEETLESCFLQSDPKFTIRLVSREGQTESELSRIVNHRLGASPDLYEAFQERVVFGASLLGPGIENSPERYLICVKAGDVLHPSLVASVHLEMLNGPAPADFYLWNEGSSKGPVFRKKPELEYFTLLHFNYFSYCFAFRAGLASSIPAFERCFRENNLHLFLLELLQRNEVKVVTIPHCLMVRDLPSIPEERRTVESSLPGYQRYFDALDLILDRERDRLPYSLTPRRRPSSISVIISFRDKPELTCDAIRSVMEQEFEGSVHIILVNNQSSPKSLDLLKKYIREVESEKRLFKLLDYDAPFNHSAQCNLGFKETTGESVIFLNNDARFGSRGTMGRMASWSIYPGIGTVGVRILDPETQELVSAGIAISFDFGRQEVLMEESRAPEYAGENRETMGNSFACVAISRKNWERVGPLDEIHFPNGYNDADYNLRCRRAGLRNLYLGTTFATHRPGTTRRHSDEVCQRTLLRRKYPELLLDSLFQLVVEDHSGQESNQLPLRVILKAFCRWPLHKIRKLITRRS